MKKILALSNKYMKSYVLHNYFKSYTKSLYKPLVALASFGICYHVNNNLVYNDPIETSADSLISLPITPATTIDYKNYNGLINTSSTITTNDNELTLYQSIVGCFVNTFKSIYRITILWLYFLPPILLSPILIIQIPACNQWWWDIFRYSICYSGPCFIKFSQWVATRPDLFKEYVCNELSKLQSLTYIHNWRYTEKMLVDTFGIDWNQYLSISKDDVIGSGCVAQVYKGLLHGDMLLSPYYDTIDQVDLIHTKNSSSNLVPTDLYTTNSNTSATLKRYSIPIALKILHPNIRESLQIDLQLLRYTTSIFEYITGTFFSFYHSIYNNKSFYFTQSTSNPLVCVSLSDSITEFALFMEQQLDMNQEGKALNKFQHNFAKSKYLKDKVIIPQPWHIYKQKHLKNYNLSSSSSSSSDIILSNKSITSSVNKEYQCISNNKDILIESYEDGISMIDILHSTHSQQISSLTPITLSKKRIIADEMRRYNSYLAELGLDIILKMIFEDNFIHADLHAGNILVRFENISDDPLDHNISNNIIINSNNATTTNNSHINKHKRLPLHGLNRKKKNIKLYPKLILLDAGLIVELQPYDRRNFIALFKAVLDNNGREVARLIMEYTPTNQSNLVANMKEDMFSNSVIIDPEGYKDEMQELVNKVHEEGLLLSKISVSKLLKQLLQISYDHQVKLESRFVSIVLSIILAEGMGKQLDPDINIILKAMPYIKSAAIKLLFEKK